MLGGAGDGDEAASEDSVLDGGLDDGPAGDEAGVDELVGGEAGKEVDAEDGLEPEGVGEETAEAGVEGATGELGGVEAAEEPGGAEGAEEACGDDSSGDCGAEVDVVEG